MLKLMRRSRRVRPVLPPRSAFAGFRFPREVIVLAVRWYLRYGLSYRDVEELLAERGVQVDHVSIYRWVQRFTPLLIDAARPCRHVTGDQWFVDETYVKVAGQWVYLYGRLTSSDRSPTCWSPRSGTWRPLAGSSPVPWSTAHVPARSAPIRRPPIREWSRSCCPRRAMSWSSTPLTRSSPIMDSSSPGRGQCGASNNSAALK